MGVSRILCNRFQFLTKAVPNPDFDNGQLGASIGVLLAFSLAYAAVAGYLVSFIEVYTNHMVVLRAITNGM